MDARLLLAVAAAPVLVAGCGSGGGSPQVANLSTGATTTTSSGGPIVPAGGTFARFVTCMREHGVQAQLGPGGHGVSIAPGPGAKAGAGRAQAACQKYLPGGGPPALTPAQQAAQVRALVAAARCMRRNGVPHFPDPNAQGEFPAQAQIDKASPVFQAAMAKCQMLIPKHKEVAVR